MFGRPPVEHAASARKSLKLARGRAQKLLGRHRRQLANVEGLLMCRGAIEEFGHWNANMSNAALELENAGQRRRGARIRVQKAVLGDRLEGAVLEICMREFKR
jgi:hypothetical protein